MDVNADNDAMAAESARLARMLLDHQNRRVEVQPTASPDRSIHAALTGGSELRGTQYEVSGTIVIVSLVFYAQVTVELTFNAGGGRLRFVGNAGGIMMPLSSLAGLGAWFNMSPQQLVRSSPFEFHVLQTPGVVQIGWAKAGVGVGSAAGGGATGLGAGGGLGNFVSF